MESQRLRDRIQAVRTRLADQGGRAAAEAVGEPEDDFESDRREWVPLASIPALILKGDVPSSNAAAATLLLHHMRLS
jgi:hypothetical protein